MRFQEAAQQMIKKSIAQHSAKGLALATHKGCMQSMKSARYFKTPSTLGSSRRDKGLGPCHADAHAALPVCKYFCRPGMLHLSDGPSIPLKGPQVCKIHLVASLLWFVQLHHNKHGRCLVYKHLYTFDAQIQIRRRLTNP